jgi:arabinose-5-phosphate isomerase
MTDEQIIDIGKQVISLEAKCLESVSAGIDSSFSRAVHAIIDASGRVVITGIGKSAIIAQKMVATFNSTGTPSIFMHAADAIHGDLGIITAGDIVIAISNSGETAEMLVLLPILKQRGNTVIGITAGRTSTLSMQSDITLYLPVDKEADPHNLAPTSSTTAQIAIGDALAVALIQYRGFTDQDFARVHPGGILGKRLYLTVGDACRNNAKPSVSPDADIRQVIIAISSGRLGAAAVVQDDVLMGIVTDGDLRRMLETGKDINQLRASDIMSPQPKWINKQELAVAAKELLSAHNITQVIVMDDSRYDGILHLHDLMREGLI